VMTEPIRPNEQARAARLRAHGSVRVDSPRRRHAA
jgi:hypothetical protein